MTIQTRSLKWVLAVLAAAAGLVAPFLSVPQALAATPATVAVRFSVVARGLTQPTCATSARDGTARVFVCEKTGRIRVVQGRTLLPTPYADLSRFLDTTSERGLLSIAFAPGFPTVPWVFVAYTQPTGTLVVGRMSAPTRGQATVSTSTLQQVITVSHPTYANHNGGQLAFGPDGYLYISTGDGGGAGDPFARAQNTRYLNGKILRIDALHACGASLYCVPSTNPFATSTVARREIWLWGLRNPWRFSFDRVTHNMWIGDVGQNRYEEVDIVSPRGGFNMGWSCLEGRAVYLSSRCISGAKYAAPHVVYSHAVGDAITGGYVYRGAAYAALLGGLYVFGDYGSGRIWVYQYNGALAGQGVLLPGLTSFGEDDSRELLAVTIAGVLYRAVARPA